MKILLVGCGGIGSMLCSELHRLILNDQIDINTEITIADNDIVEMKNIKYQNFSTKEISKNKAEVLSERYCFNAQAEKITNVGQLSDFDLIVIAVDNSSTRKLVFDYCYKNNIYFIDLRCEGRAVAFFTKEADKERLIGTLGEISDEGKSCQLQYDLDSGRIQNGNVIISSLGSQLILNYLRGEQNPKEFIFRV